MYRDFTYEAVLGSSEKAAWRLDDVFGPDHRLDFSRPFLPEPLARTAKAPGLTDAERLLLNQISGHQYLSLFGIIEEFILPFLMDHARPLLNSDDYRVRALLNFATEEAKHIQLFKRFRQAFENGFSVRCPMIGPAEAIGAKVLSHDPLAVALVILHVEWMTQSHYLDSVQVDCDIDPLFKSLLRHHWMEEAQHAKLDTLMVEALAEGRSADQVAAAFDEYLQIVAFINGGLEQQARFNLFALEAAIGRTVQDSELLVSQQLQAARWTYLGSGMMHASFLDTVEKISPASREQMGITTPLYC